MEEIQKKKIEVVLSPALFQFRIIKTDSIIVMVDILRASTTICTALANGVSGIKPVATFENAKSEKANGYLVAAESNGIKPDFADFGNSALEFINQNFDHERIVYCTTNGTKAIIAAEKEGMLAIGAFSNLTALTDWLLIQNKNVVILCSGWKNMFNLEDTVFAGALSENLINSGKYITDCDATHASIDLWKFSKPNLKDYMTKALHNSRLHSLNLEDVIPYTFLQDTTNVVPVLQNGWLTDILKNSAKV